MEKQKKLNYIKKVVPVLYSVAASLMCLYITLRTRTFLNLLLPFETGYLLAALLIIYLFLMHDISIHYFVAKSKIGTWLAGTSVFLVMYLFITIGISDILQAFIHISVKDPVQRDTIFVYCGFACIVVVLLLAFFAMYKANTIKVKNMPVSMENFEGTYRLVLLSDLHIGYYVGTYLIQKIVDKVNGLQPDLVVISGDIINSGNTRECPKIDQVAKILSTIKAKEGVYAITGNHDPDAKDPEFVKFMKNAHIHLLDDSVYTNEHFHLAGRGTRTKKRKDLKYILRGLSKDKPVVVLDHDPLGIKEAAQYHTDLVMCGHTHKGQIFPLNLFVRFLYKKDELWGYSKRDKTNVIVSAGTGYFSMPMRLGSDSEIICVDLTKQI